jgi:hypothetical protein
MAAELQFEVTASSAGAPLPLARLQINSGNGVQTIPEAWRGTQSVVATRASD